MNFPQKRFWVRYTHIWEWCRKRLYPTLAAANAMEFETNQTIYKNRLDELCAGKLENEFDAWLRDRFYPIVAMMS